MTLPSPLLPHPPERTPQCAIHPAILILLAITLLAVLAALLTPKYGGGPQPKITRAFADIDILKDALNAIHDDNARYPTTAEGLAALTTQPPNTPRWKKHLDEIRSDPWEHPFLYKSPGDRHPQSFDLSSPGHDGEFGTDDDITN